MPEPVTGLSSAEVAQRVTQGQVNTLPPRSGRTTWGIVAANTFTRINAILGILFALVLTTGHVLQGAFGLLIIANSAIGIVQELRAKRTLDSLAVVGEAMPTVVRDGQETMVARDEVVLDDVIAIRPGDQLVVDGQVVAAEYLEVDESLLTGEADPIPKSAGDEVLSGSFVSTGTGYYRATKVGADAYAAQVSAEAAKFTLVNSELRSGVDRIIKFVSYLLIPVGLLAIIVQFRQGSSWQDSVLRMTGVLVPMIPEGLVLLTSMAFAVGVIRLGRRNVLVQELPAIEGLARVSVVCADKTGTLTENKLALTQIIGLDGEDHTEVLQQIAAADPAPNASIQALIEQLGLPEQLWPVNQRQPFSSAKKYSGVSFESHGHWLLGAPDVLGDPQTAAQAAEYGDRGLRVLLLARSNQPVDQAPHDVAPAALVVMDQAIRPDAEETLAFFTDQGVKVKVISGDNANSVGAVTRQLGMTDATVVDARELPEPGDEFTHAVGDGDVFGRVTPQQKRNMVDALRSQGETVAMTGDGVNDVLALKNADLGVAMGSGSSATRAVAQIVLLDDTFATLPHVVAEGRRVIGNIERVAKLFLTKTVYAVLLALLTGILQVPSPFLPLQITVVGWFTIGIPAFLLSLAPNHERARPGFVGRVLGTGVPSGVIVGVAAVVSYLMVRGLGPVGDVVQEQATTAALAALLISSCWVLAVVSRPWVWWRIGLVIFAYAFYTLMFLLPFSRSILNLNIADPHAIWIGVVAGVIGAGCVEIAWWFTARYRGERARVWR